ncbi:MAG: sugar ABC transporter ATP-binding protein [Candidatus Sericytochromatia bacterium]|nr:sugar ABC transporter ATP-binding protein [Candidatus Sericytochromatia bacterium]
MTVAAPPVLSVRGLRKAFGAVRALSGVDLEVRAGEVLVLLGENGAGKSTLLKTLSGMHVPDAGEVRIRDKVLPFGNPAASEAAGIVTIYQEFNLVPDLTIAENLFLGQEPHRLGLVDHARMRREATGMLQRVGLAVDPGRKVRELGVAHAQLVEIAKALSRLDRSGGGVLTLDEPTAALADHEIAVLHGLVRDLRQRGQAIIYISHRMAELRAIGDRVTVLRDGASVCSGPLSDLDDDALIRAMVGRDVATLYPDRTPSLGEPVLEVVDLVAPGFGPVTMTVRRGEIVGLAGLMGSGRSRLLRLLYGDESGRGGNVRVAGRELQARQGPAGAVAAGIGLVPEDRKNEGLALGMPVRDNLALASLERHVRAGLLQSEGLSQSAKNLVERLRIRCSSIDQPVGRLSGGNQQKVVLGRWLARGGAVLLLDEPTRGVDVGARAEIYRLMAELAQEGLAIVMVSSDLPEVLGMADRVLVMREGRPAGWMAGDAMTQEAVMRLATGQEVGA